MSNEITNIKVKARNAGGWNGAHGTAYTVTGLCPDGKRRVCSTNWNSLTEMVDVRAKTGKTHFEGPRLVEEVWVGSITRQEWDEAVSA